MVSYPVQDGEQVLWSGRPHRPEQWFLEPVMLVLFIVAFVVVNFVMMSQDTFPWSFWVLAGFFPALLSTGEKRLANRRALSMATVYLVTDRRIIFVSEWPSGAEFRWVWLGQLAAPQVRAEQQGFGTITFQRGRWARMKEVWSTPRGAWAPFAPRLRSVPEAARVADLILRVQQGSRAVQT